MFKRALFLRPLVALALAATAALMSAPVAHAAGPPMASASATTAPQASLVSKDAKVGHGAAIAVGLGLFAVIAAVFVVLGNRIIGGSASESSGPAGVKNSLPRNHPS